MRKMCWIGLLGFFLFGGVQTGLGDVNGVTKPNVLFLVIDDLKPLLGCYGNTQIKTPNIDRLAERGTVFLDQYCQEAICAPSRMSMFTGLRPDTTKVWDLKTYITKSCPSAFSMQEYFKKNGYTTAGCGKVMHGARDEWPAAWSIPFRHDRDLKYADGFPVPAHEACLYQGKREHEVYDELLKTNITNWRVRWTWMRDHNASPSMEFLDIPDDAYSDGAMANYASGLLKKFAKEKKPFFLTVGFHKPHLPFVAPKKYWDLYSDDEIKLAAFRQHAKDSPEFAYQPGFELRNYTDIPKFDTPIKDEKQRDLIHGYYACVSYVDAQVGKVLDQLDESGLSENTIIVLWGDHGWHLGDHSMWCKHSNFEQATRSPLIIAAPNFPKDQKTKALVESIDIFPTLCQLAQLPVPNQLQGKSLVPELKNPKAKGKPFVISQYPRGGGLMGYAMRTDRYRLVVWMQDDWRSTQPFDPALIKAIELYDYKKDPLETVNLARNPEYKEQLDGLMKQLKGFFKTQENPSH